MFSFGFMLQDLLHHLNAAALQLRQGQGQGPSSHAQCFHAFFQEHSSGHDILLERS
jgi:hypothetical protein